MPELQILSERLSRVRPKIAALGLDAFLFSDMQNIRYIVGFTGSDGALLVGHRKTILLVDGRYTTQAGKEVQGAEVREYREKMEGISATVRDNDWKIIGLESAALTLEEYLKLRDKLADLEMKTPEGAFNQLRIIKDDDETDQIKKAADISSEALRLTLAGIKPGLAERDVAADMEWHLRRGGADSPSFDIIVASGENAAMPHAKPGSRTLEKGDFIVLDYGAVYRGYRSDETCTVALGQISEKQKKVYGIVKEAHDRAVEAVKAGVACEEVDRVARSVIEEKGLGKFFTHGTGHGVGLCVHEEPRISALSKSVLEAGMVITIEPGVYLPGAWGVRIEDMVLVEQDGCRVLTTAPKDLIIL